MFDSFRKKFRKETKSNLKSNQKRNIGLNGKKVDKIRKLCALIGNPVSHSLSPTMHNAAFEYLGLDYNYIAFEIDEPHLLDTVMAFKQIGVVGFNVTSPFKTSIIRYLDGISSEAEKIDAVNTVVNQNDRFVGYNTDVFGTLRTLENSKIRIKDEHFLIIGGGGAAKAVAYALLKEKGKVMISNRTYESAKKIADRFEDYGDIDAVPMGNELKDKIEKIKVIVNCTPVGMVPNVNNIPIDTSLIRKEMVVFDLVYTPLETMLIKEAKKRGAKTISGIDMLVYQGAASFELWLGRKAPVEIMRNAVEETLNQTSEWKYDRSRDR
ncbi:MAG: shikimate dehydrogenase [Thermoplasmata archaeon]